MHLKLICAFFITAALARSAGIAKPEAVGLSDERLHRIHGTIQRHIDARQMSGAVTLVARKGRVAHLETHGVMDIDSKKPMAKDAIFRIWSMSKPVTGVAILMLMEEGKVRLSDPVSNFIPEFKQLKVAVAQERAAAATGSQPAPLQFYSIPATREITVEDLLIHVSGLGSGPASIAEMTRIARKEGETLADFIPRLGTCRPLSTEFLHLRDDARRGTNCRVVRLIPYALDLERSAVRLARSA